VALAGREICFPRRAVTDLDPEQQQNALAHELAHLLRRDPAWRWIGALVEHVFFFQPLNRVARRGLKDSAEFLCDDWAVTQTGQHLTLAKCLVEVAGWLDPRPEAAHAAGMAEPGSPLVRRVERLLGVRASREISTGWRVAGATALLCLVMAVAPVVTPVHERPEAMARNAAFGTSPAEGPLRSATPLRFDGMGSAGAPSGTPDARPAVPAPPAPPSPEGPVFEVRPASPAPGFAPRARTFRSVRVARRDVRWLPDSRVVVTASAPEPAVVWTWELPAAPLRAKLAALRASLDRQRTLEDEVLPALQTQIDPALLERMGRFLKQVEAAETLSLEVSTPLEHLDPQLRIEALQQAEEMQLVQVQVFFQQLKEFQELHRQLTPEPPAARSWIPTGSI